MNEFLYPSGARVPAELADNGNAAAFFGETLPLKATMAMRLADHPGRAQWIPIKNPMAGALRT